MKTKRLGCLNSTGWIAVFLVVVIVLAFEFIRGGILFSPGKLSAQTRGQDLNGVHSHSDLNGRCSACHPPFWSQATMAEFCQNCHADLLKNPKSFHSVMLAEGKLSSCKSCHPDHNGSEASLIRLELQEFPHNKLGYSLQGHQKRQNGQAFACSDCHGVDYSKFDPQTCIECHTQIDAGFLQTHQAAYGDQCLDCHDGVDRFGKGFDHTNLQFTLQGKHLALECSQCHSGSRQLADFTSTPQNCSGCHSKDDAHQGSLGNDCSECHTPEDWHNATFDHTLSVFKLEDKHQSVPCQQCHLPGPSGKPVFKGTPQDCYACHAKDDHHQGTLGQECNLCHTPAGWTPATIDHSKTAFPLLGKHQDVSCEKCHQSDSSGKPVFLGTPQDCFACHAKDDHHQGAYGQDCGVCHSPEGWTPATFDHSKSAFPLTGAHAGVACDKCHVQGQNGMVFQGTPTQCVGCHSDPGYHRGLFGTECSSCHTTSGWTPAKFSGSHSFPIGHGGANTCRRCHPSTLRNYTCYTCHKKADITGKHREEGIGDFSNCIRCHPKGRGGN